MSEPATTAANTDGQGETDEYTAVHLVQLPLCSACLDGEGDECHTPGCVLWMHSVPAPAIRNDPRVTVAPVPELGAVAYEAAENAPLRARIREMDADLERVKADAAGWAKLCADVLDERDEARKQLAAVTAERDGLLENNLTLARNHVADTDERDQLRQRASDLATEWVKRSAIAYKRADRLGGYPRAAQQQAAEMLEHCAASLRRAAGLDT